MACLNFVSCSISGKSEAKEYRQPTENKSVEALWDQNQAERIFMM
jgi:hypothetical protein